MLTSSESVIWKVPAPTWARRKVKEWRELGEGETDKRTAIANQLPPLTEYRLTFSTVTMAEEIKRDELLTSVREKFEEQYQIDPGSFSLWFVDKHVREGEPRVEYPLGESMTKIAAAAIFMKTRDMADWATFMSALHLLEERQLSMLNGSDPKWQKISVPKEWLTFEGFLGQVPRQLLDSCIQVCNDLNPGVWEVAMDEDSKNFGGVNVAS